MASQETKHLNREEIEIVLPQKGNIVFLGEATVILGESATATLAEVPMLVENGFSEVPHFVLTEGMAQTLTLVRPPEGDNIGVLLGIDKMTVTRRPKISENVVFGADSIRMLGNAGRARVTTKVGDKTLVEGNIMFAVASLEALKNAS